MDAQLESLVELYLTRGGKVFVSPQYDIPYDKDDREGGACPDILALDMGKREVVVVEVSSASNVTDLLKRVADREARWFSPIRRRLEADRVIGPDWGIRFLGFVREAIVESSKARFADQADVCFFPLEQAAFSFAYWTEREKGLPR
jgi:hypothetical protein